MVPPIKVEYAKSARSRCTLKTCNLFIQKGEVRIGTGSMMPGADELTYKWRHLCCFSGRQIKNIHASVDNIDGFEDLEEPHQAIIHKMLKGQLEGDNSIKGAVVSAVIAGSAGDGDGKAKKKKAGVGATLMGNSNVDLLSQKTSTQLGKKRPRGPAVTLEGALVDTGAESDATDEYEVGITNQKPMCPHGASCFRKNPDYFKEYRHAGDKDINLEDNHMQPTVVKKYVKEGGHSASANAISSSSAPPVASSKPVVTSANASSGKQVCPYGATCVLKTPAHLHQYLHGAEAAKAGEAPIPHSAIHNALTTPASPTGSTNVTTNVGGGGVANSSKKVCPYLPMCLRSDAKHLAEFSH